MRDKKMAHNPIFLAMRTARRLRRDRKGVSAIEFALIFPILIVLMAGATDLGQALMVHRKINQIVATTADLVSQQSSWTTTQLDAVLKGASSIVLPFSTDALTIKVAIIDIDKSYNKTENWSRAFNATSKSCNMTASAVTIPNDIVESGVQMVVATATYCLTTPFSSLMQSVTGTLGYEYDRFSIMRPRTKDTITLN